MAKKQKTSVRVQVTYDFDFGRFWDEDNTLEEIQHRAENLLHNATNDLDPKPKIVGKVVVLLSGGT